MNNIIIENDMREIYDAILPWEKLKNKTILITGSYGMIASYLVYYLIFLNNSYKYNIKLVFIVKNKNKFTHKFHNLNNTDYILFLDDLTSTLKFEIKIDYVFHAASLASPSFYSNNPVDVLKPNIIGTYNLLEFCKEHLNRNGCFIFFSSGNIYGKPINNNLVTESNFGICDTQDTQSCYCESKRMGETLCDSYFRQYNIPNRIVRIWHTYAPTMDLEKDTRVFSSFTKNIVNNENIIMLSDGKGLRTFLYITDAIIGLFTILFYGENNQAYNLCNSNQYISILDLAKIMVNIYPQKNLKVIQAKRDINDNYVENIYLKDTRSLPSNEKLKKLGWNCKVNVQEGFKRVIDYNE